jgi:mRNA-degrading endonuclease RelE of RelBE toxin-antitoxin system
MTASALEFFQNPRRTNETMFQKQGRNLTLFRVFYEVDQVEKVVTVLAIGVKEGNRLFISEEELKL